LLIIRYWKFGFGFRIKNFFKKLEILAY